MKILVINGDCIQVNTSANLCHIAYLRGLIEAGHEVTLLSASGKDYIIDKSLIIPPEIRHFSFNGVTIYERLSMKKKTHKRSEGAGIEEKKNRKASSLKRNVVNIIKQAVLNCYGVHGIYIKFVRKAMKFKSDEMFDFMISLSTPVTSHLLAYRLGVSGRVKYKHWIQIWEDPWYSDAYGFNKKERVLKEERYLLSLAEKVCYVSPITLEYQKQLFPESAGKMFWEPLPAYYTYLEDMTENNQNRFGYFGDYYLPARNLKPFYEAAVKSGINVTICGDSNIKLQSNHNIRIFSRMPLKKLRNYEKETDVLVFLCNQAGGQIPGKIYQYAATTKIVLFILDGTEHEKQVIRHYFEPFGRFIFCENTEEEIKLAIEKILLHHFEMNMNNPLLEFAPVAIVQRILEKGMSNINE